jgi:hypothetical protein
MPPDPNILPDGLMIPLMGSATVGWQNATQLGGGSCSFTPVPTMTGTASPLTAGLEIVDGPNGKLARFQSALSASGSALAVIFPGPNGLWNQADIPLTLSDGQWTGSLGYNNACGGSCCSPILPVSVSYNVTIDVATRAVTLNVGGSLPAGPPPSPNACWCNRGNLNGSFTGRVP